MENRSHLSRELFLECNWKYEPSLENGYSYSQILFSLKEHSKLMAEKGNENGSNLFELLAKPISMRLQPDSLSEPFLPYFIDSENGRRSTKPEDFLEEELNFFNQILCDINEPYLKARLADLLWLISIPRNPEHAKIAIDSYITGDINGTLWSHGECKVTFERALRLSKQIKDYERLNTIKEKLFNTFILEHIDYKFLPLSIAQLMHKLNVDDTHRVGIATLLIQKGYKFKENNDFHAAEYYFDLASKKYQQLLDSDKRVECLIGIAECIELEADLRSRNSNTVANSIYERAVQAYRKIPKRYRETYLVDKKVLEIRKKMTITGQASLDEMVTFETKSEDLSEHVEESIKLVKQAKNVQEGVVFFTKLYSGPNHEKLVEMANSNLNGSLLSSIFGACHRDDNGKVVAKVPAMNWADPTDPNNAIALSSQMNSLFKIQVGLTVNVQILPALRQLHKEYRLTKDLMVAICHQSPLVPDDRIYLLGHGLWLGFEEEFGIAIHLICPQIEHIVRSKLKENQITTTHLDKDGIENEYGLSTLMDLPETEQILGKSLVFELKSIFTEALGSNLRNMVAHGLLDDDNSASEEAVYAWWLTLRLVISSILDGDIKRE